MLRSYVRSWPKTWKTFMSHVISNKKFNIFRRFQNGTHILAQQACPKYMTKNLPMLCFILHTTQNNAAHTSNPSEKTKLCLSQRMSIRIRFKPFVKRYITHWNDIYLDAVFEVDSFSATIAESIQFIFQFSVSCILYTRKLAIIYNVHLNVKLTAINEIPLTNGNESSRIRSKQNAGTILGVWGKSWGGNLTNILVPHTCRFHKGLNSP